MVQVPFEGDLQIDQHLDSQYRLWRVQRIGWALLAVLLLAALVGLFGSGPLAGATAGKDAALEVEYNRIVRRGGETELEIRLGAEVISDGTATLFIDEKYAKAIKLERLSPEPAAEGWAEGWLVYLFAVPEGADEVTVRADVTHRGIGPVTGRFSIDREEVVKFRQIVLP